MAGSPSKRGTWQKKEVFLPKDRLILPSGALECFGSEEFPPSEINGGSNEPDEFLTLIILMRETGWRSKEGQFDVERRGYPSYILELPINCSITSH